MSRQMAPVEEQLFVLMSGVEYGDTGLRRAFAGELRERLEEDRPLRVYLGIDPTATSLTLGHAVPLRKLRQFQDFGHEAIFLIGDTTAMIGGDPSDKNALRPQLTIEDIAINEGSYFEQAASLIDPALTVLKHNSEWLSRLDLKDLISLMSKFTVAEMLSRDNFRKRHQAGDAVYLHEFLYALLQGYDAYALECDVQVGGTEQLFNLMAGRKIQEDAGQRKHVPITMPILVGVDGVLRMSKSTGNFIGLDEAPADQYGKAMSIPDSALANYFELATSLDRADVAETVAALARGERDPLAEKKRLARTIVTELHGEAAAEEAEAHFERTIQGKELMEDADATVTVPFLEGETYAALLVRAGMVKSRREAVRLVEQGGLRPASAVFWRGANSPEHLHKATKDPNALVWGGGTLRLNVGKRRSLRVYPPVN